MAQLAKDVLGEGRFNAKFVGALHELSTRFVHHLAEESNNFTQSKGKSKILEEDVYKLLRDLGFEDKDFADFRGRLKEFEHLESVKKENKSRFKDELYASKIDAQNEMLFRAAEDVKGAGLVQPRVEAHKIEQKKEQDDFDEF